MRELDDYVSALAARYRAQGPPTLLYVALSMLGYSALLQGKPDLADRFFDEAISIDVPDRTVSVNKPIEARAAFRRGNRSAAFRILRAYVDELLETDYPDLAANAAVEFINMMAIIDRLPAAARVLDYLRAAGDFGALAARTLVADAAAQVAANAERIPDQDRSPEPRLDARHALRYMRDVLDALDACRRMTCLVHSHAEADPIPRKQQRKPPTAAPPTRPSSPAGRSRSCLHSL